MTRTLLSFLTATAVLLPSLGAQQDWHQLYRQPGSQQDGRFGATLAALGDLDGDGYGEVLVGSPGDSRAGAGAGSIQVLNGEDGRLVTEILGIAVGDAFGSAVLSLGDWDGDGREEIAVGAPGAAGPAGGCQGFVRVYDGSTGALLGEVVGRSAGAAFGHSLAAYDGDGDGRKELAVGAPGAFGGDGAVHLFQWSQNALVELLASPVAGRVGSGEAFGFALAAGGVIPRHRVEWLLISAPLADDNGVDSGALAALALSQVVKRFTPTGPGAGLGASLDVVREGEHAWIAAGAPALDKVVILDAFSGKVRPSVHGYPGTGFGTALAFLGDRNFDGRPDLAVGAPQDGAGGQLEVLDVFGSGIARPLWTMAGEPGSELGTAAALLGDLTGTDQPELAIGCPQLADASGVARGGVEVWSPDGSRPPLSLELLDPLVLDSQVSLECREMIDHSDLYWFVGTADSPSTSAGGLSLGISGLFGGLPGSDYFAHHWDVTGGVSQESFALPISFGPGEEVYFQVVELRGQAERPSSVVGGVIEDREMECFLDRPIEVLQTSLLQTRYAHRQTSAIVYYFLGQQFGSETFLGIHTGLASPYFVVNPPGTFPDAYGNASYSWQVPSEINSHSIQGLLVYLTSVSWFQGNERWTYTGPHLIR